MDNDDKNCLNILTGKQANIHNIRPKTTPTPVLGPLSSVRKHFRTPNRHCRRSSNSSVGDQYRTFIEAVKQIWGSRIRSILDQFQIPRHRRRRRHRVKHEIREAPNWICTEKQTQRPRHRRRRRPRVRTGNWDPRFGYHKNLYKAVGLPMNAIF